MTHTIRNEKYMRKINDMTGLTFGAIMPTDIDGFMEIHDKLFIFFETKYGNAPIEGGQRLALERIADALWKAGKVVFVLHCRHYESGFKINVAQCDVVQTYYQGKWSPPRQPCTVLAAVNGMIKQHIDEELWKV